MNARMSSFLIPDFFNISGVRVSIIQLLVKSVAIVLSLFGLHVAIYHPQFSRRSASVVAARKHKEIKDGCHVFITPPKACWDQL